MRSVWLINQPLDAAAAAASSEGDVCELTRGCHLHTHSLTRTRTHTHARTHGIDQRVDDDTWASRQQIGAVSQRIFC
jgi:hypothetical protein